MERDFYSPNNQLLQVKEKISVVKARRILGDLAKGLDDTQVQEIISTFTLLARERLVYNGSKVKEKKS